MLPYLGIKQYFATENRQEIYDYVMPGPKVRRSALPFVPHHASRELADSVHWNINRRARQILPSGSNRATSELDNLGVSWGLSFHIASGFHEHTNLLFLLTLTGGTGKALDRQFLKGSSVCGYVYTRLWLYPILWDCIAGPSVLEVLGEIALSHSGTWSTAVLSAGLWFFFF